MTPSECCVPVWFISRSAQASGEILELWLANCESRGDKTEGAQVACELGDRALNAGDSAGARHWFERALEVDPSNELSVRRLQRLTSGGAPVSTTAPAPEGRAPAAKATPGTPAPTGSPPKARTKGGSGTEGDSGLPEPGRVEVAVGRGEAVTFDLGSLISEFQRGVEAQLSGDAQSHYDLAMAYREMGLLEQAVESFRIAAATPALATRAAEMIGRCLLDQGRFEDAAEELSLALQRHDLEPGTVAGLSFQLGLAFEAAGQSQEALAQFERVYSVQPNYPDVALKIRVLRKSLEKV